MTENPVFDSGPPGDRANGAAAATVRTSPNERGWACALHLSSLLFLAVPILGLAGPLFVWMLKYDESDLIDHHGRVCFDFGLTLLVWWAAILAFGVLTCGVGWFLVAPLTVYGIVASIVAAVHAKRGERWRHPLTLRLFS